MQHELIQPFLASLGNSLRQLLHCDLRPGEANLATGRLYDVSGIVSLSGPASGLLIVSFSETLALKLSGSLLLVQSDQLDDDVIDALGDLIESIAAGAKSELGEGECFTSLPSMVTGPRHRVRFPAHVTPISVPCETPWGPLMLELGLAPSGAWTGTAPCDWQGL